ncbi:MarR family transcriptional regulator, partial [Anoxybacillus sp. LAT_38]|nr:MarR family transcriptional regulator [Anoxybacillus sp. LAT_38]
MSKPILVRDLLKRLNKTITTMATRELGKFGLTVPQLMVLRQIKCEPKTIGQISKAVDLSYSTVS